MEAGDKILVTGGEHQGKTGKVLTQLFKVRGVDIKVPAYVFLLQFADGEVVGVQDTYLRVISPDRQK